jgi:predicted nucleic acid-binding protein
MSADPVFIDTNVLVAAAVDLHPSHGVATAYLARLAAEGGPACISGQVCREILVGLTRSPVEGRVFSVDEALSVLEKARASFVVLDEDDAVLRELLELVRRYDVKGKQLHDANIVATMRANGVRRLTTLNVADFERYEDVIQLERLVS